jgi:hypothetical protein
MPPPFWIAPVSYKVERGDGKRIQAAMSRVRCTGLVIGGLLACAEAPAQQPTPAVDLKDIAAVCSGLETATAAGGRGTISTDKGYSFEVAEDNQLRITQTGRLISKIDHFTYENYAKCVSDIVSALTAVKPPPPKACRIPENGVERYSNVFDITRESGWRGGGYDPNRWCNDVITMLKGEHPGANVTITGQREDEESKCKPFNCPQYNYKCSVHVEADPVYREAVSSLCP